MTSMLSMYSTMALFIWLAERSYWVKLLPLIWKVSPMQRKDRGNVTSDASASRQLMHSSAAMLRMGKTI